MKFASDMFFCLVTIAFLGWSGYAAVAGYGGRWRFGGDGVPESLIDWNRRTYWNGSAVDPFTLKLVESGREHDVMLIVIVLTACHQAAKWRRRESNPWLLRIGSD